MHSLLTTAYLPSSRMLTEAVLGHFSFLQLLQLISDIPCDLCLPEIATDWKEPTVYVRLPESLPRHLLSWQNKRPLHKEVLIRHYSK